MKKLVLTIVSVACFANLATAQVDKAALEARKKELSEGLKKAEAEVKGAPTKPKSHLNYAIALLDVASYPDSTLAGLDIEAPFKALDAISELNKLDAKGSLKKDVAKLYDEKKVYQAFMNIGVLKYQGKDYKTSFRFMSKASEVSPKDTIAAMYTGVVAQLSNNDKAAGDAYEKYVDLGGKDMAILYGLSQIYKNAKNEEKALAVIDKGISLYPDNKDLRNEKFNLLISFNRIDQAIETLEKQPNKDAATYSNLGLLFENKMSGFKDQANKIAEKSSKIGEFQKRIDSQKGQIDAFTDEVKRLKNKLKTTPPKQKASIQQQITLNEADIKEKTKILEGYVADKANAEKTVGDPAANAAQLAELQVKIKEIREKVPAYYENALKLDPTYYDALYQLGALNYNDAAEIKRVVNSMDMETFKKEGKSYEDKIAAKYKEALPYFEKAFEVKKDEDLKEIMKQIYREIKDEAKLQKLN
ncbi:hypothetical protein EOJ36_00515 [Sandaracinomonas limnophila]|uniref:Tetratricopeptide repeat protein n=1 Tax=Sandaracinomonas limnophila TaxID=1862386 RepID=A0A437PW85_9BACT|nr:hypothetical protein [Sandaracinomonas limnophila]RVU26513.1 hypothetical protein EOJ36_00515 [Sandaracinomonas limnophila]